MSNAIELSDLNVGDTVAYFCGYGIRVPVEAMKISRVTKLYIFLDGCYNNKFKRESGAIVNHTIGKIEHIRIPTPENKAQWTHEKLIAEFTELMNRREDFNVIALQAAIQRLLSEELTQDELIEIAACVIECKSLSNQALKESVDELWGGIC